MEKCKCQDSSGAVCGKVMTKEEVKQDGMCQVCADNVWEEIQSKDNYNWYHSSTQRK